jgi:hypothetical protein
MTDRRKHPCFAIIGQEVVKYESLTHAAIKNDFEHWQLSAAKSLALDAGDAFFVVDGMTFYFDEPTVVGLPRVSHVQPYGIRPAGGPLLPWDKIANNGLSHWR